MSSVGGGGHMRGCAGHECGRWMALARRLRPAARIFSLCVFANIGALMAAAGMFAIVLAFRGIQ